MFSQTCRRQWSQGITLNVYYEGSRIEFSRHICLMEIKFLQQVICIYFFIIQIARSFSLLNWSRDVESTEKSDLKKSTNLLEPNKRYHVLINSYMNSGSRFTAGMFGFRYHMTTMYIFIFYLKKGIFRTDSRKTYQVLYPRHSILSGQLLINKLLGLAQVHWLNSLSANCNIEDFFCKQRWHRWNIWYLVDCWIIHLRDLMSECICVQLTLWRDCVFAVFVYKWRHAGLSLRPT